MSAQNNPGPACWYCGSPATQPWQSKGFDEDKPMQMGMCATHGEGVRLSLKLRDDGGNDAADANDNANGIETRPKFNRWFEPDTALTTPTGATHD